jgi:hypothetical protein
MRVDERIVYKRTSCSLIIVLPTHHLTHILINPLLLLLQLSTSTHFPQLPNIIMSDYKPTEHDGLRKDGQPDGRVGTGEFAHGKVDPHEAGVQGGKTSGSGSSGGLESTSDDSGDYKPTEHDGLRKDGKPDGRVKGN